MNLHDAAHLLNEDMQAAQPLLRYNFNDTPTRLTMKNIVRSRLERILMNQFRLIVVCDETNNTHQIVDENRLLIDVTTTDRNTHDKNLTRINLSKNDGLDINTVFVKGDM